MSDEARHLAELQTAFNTFSCMVMATAVAGLADAAIVSNHKFNEHHSLRAVEQLAAYARQLRSGDALLKEWATKTGHDDTSSEFPGDVEELFDAGVRQGRIDLARELLMLRLEQKNEEARRIHRYQNRDAAEPEAGTGGIPPTSES